MSLRYARASPFRIENIWVPQFCRLAWRWVPWTKQWNGRCWIRTYAVTANDVVRSFCGSNFDYKIKIGPDEKSMLSLLLAPDKVCIEKLLSCTFTSVLSMKRCLRACRAPGNSKVDNKSLVLPLMPWETWNIAGRLSSTELRLRTSVFVSSFTNLGRLAYLSLAECNF